MKKNGFVFLETLVVVCVLSLTLLLLFGTYSYILRKSRERNVFDTTEMIYKTYYTKDILIHEYGNIETYINTCTKLKNSIYECSLGENRLSQLSKSFEVEKIYFFAPSDVLDDNDVILKLDATTIDYVKYLGKNNKSRRMVVKYKKTYQDGSYEVLHSSMEV